MTRIPIPIAPEVAKVKTSKTVKIVSPHMTPEVGILLIEIHQVSREIPYFYYGTGMILGVFSTCTYVVRRIRNR